MLGRFCHPCLPHPSSLKVRCVCAIARRDYHTPCTVPLGEVGGGSIGGGRGGYKKSILSPLHSDCVLTFPSFSSFPLSIFSISPWLLLRLTHYGVNRFGNSPLSAFSSPRNAEKGDSIGLHSTRRDSTGLRRRVSSDAGRREGVGRERTAGSESERCIYERRRRRETGLILIYERAPRDTTHDDDKQRIQTCLGPWSFYFPPGRFSIHTS